MPAEIEVDGDLDWLPFSSIPALECDLFDP